MIFERTFLLRNAAATAVFNDRIATYLNSSAVPYSAINKGAAALSDIEPILLPLLCTETTRFFSAGARLTRLEKTRVVASYPPAMSELDVCTTGAKVRLALDHKNCSRCWKCRRTMVGLDLLGALDDFAGVFDVESYRADPYAAYAMIRDRAQHGKENDDEHYQLLLDRGLMQPETRLKQKLRSLWRAGVSAETREKLHSLYRKSPRAPR